jgi:[ribosomal protein S18]-alanine N-acetyltransferase
MSAMFSRFFSRPDAFEITALTTADAAIAARLHTLAFQRGWTDGEFASLLAQPAVFGFLVLDPARARDLAAGFVLVREAAGEAEILSIGVDPGVRRSGLGWRLMQAAIREAAHRGAEEMFLEVDETNGGAIELYRKLNFAKVGERHAYYEHPGEPMTAAWVMRRELT